MKFWLYLLIFALITGLIIFIAKPFANTNIPLPILGEIDIVNGDTIYPQVRDFTFTNQDSQAVNNATFAGKAYIVDFFFISCPTICPKVKKQMLRLYERYAAEDRLRFLSHSIDTKHDTIPRLKKFANDLGIKTERWHLVTGDRYELYSIANDYFSVAKEDPKAPGGFDHSGRLILVDTKRHVRAFCDGTDPKSVDEFMKSIDKLLLEME
jgi:protein SCO1/2